MISRRTQLALSLALLVLPSAAWADGRDRPSGGSVVRLTRAPGNLRALVVRHRNGDDVRAQLVGTLGSMMPRGYYHTSTGLSVLTETGKDLDGKPRLGLRMSDPNAKSPLWGTYDKPGPQFRVTASAGSDITKLRYDEGRHGEAPRLQVKLVRNNEGKYSDRSPKVQKLDLSFDKKGRLEKFTISNRGRWWSPFGRKSATVDIPDGSIRTLDPVVLPSIPPKANEGTTLFSR